MGFLGSASVYTLPRAAGECIKCITTLQLGASLYDTLKARTTIPKTLVLYIIQKLGIREEWNE